MVREADHVGHGDKGLIAVGGTKRLVRAKHAMLPFVKA